MLEKVGFYGFDMDYTLAGTDLFHTLYEDLYILPSNIILIFCNSFSLGDEDFGFLVYTFLLLPLYIGRLP